MVEKDKALSPDEVEPPAPDESTLNSTEVKHAKGEFIEKDADSRSTRSSGNIQVENQVDEFGLPVKALQRQSTSTLAYETASEDNDSKASHREEELAPSDTQNDEQKKKLETDITLASTGHDGDSIPPSSEISSAAHTDQPFCSSHRATKSEALSLPATDDILHGNTGAISGWSHQALGPQKVDVEEKKVEDEWQTMPSYARYDLYDDDDRLIAREAPESDEEANAYHGLGGAGKGYTRVQDDEDAKSTTSMDENTDYLFKSPRGTDLSAEDEDQRDPLSQLQATKELLTGGQRIAYVGITRLALAAMVNELVEMESTRSTKKAIALVAESAKLWGQKIMVRLYVHMDISSSGKSRPVRIPQSTIA